MAQLPVLVTYLHSPHGKRHGKTHGKIHGKIHGKKQRMDPMNSMDQYRTYFGQQIHAMSMQERSY